MENNDVIDVLRGQVERQAAEIDELKTQVANLVKSVFVGNGQPSLISRMGAVEAQLGTIAKLLWVVVSSCVGILAKLFLG